MARGDGMGHGVVACAVVGGMSAALLTFVFFCPGYAIDPQVNEPIPNQQRVVGRTPLE